MLIYRSTRVKDTSSLYADVAKLILEAEEQDVLYDETVEDDEMVLGEGQCLLLRLAAAGHERGYSRDVVTKIIEGINDEKEVA